MVGSHLELYTVQDFYKIIFKSNTIFKHKDVFRLEFLNECKVFLPQTNQTNYISGLFEKTLRKT